MSYATHAVYLMAQQFYFSLQWRHNGCDSISNHQPYDCLLNRLFRRRSMKTSKLRITGLCAGNSPETGEFSAQMASNAENVSIWWRHHVISLLYWLWIGINWIRPLHISPSISQSEAETKWTPLIYNSLNTKNYWVNKCHLQNGILQMTFVHPVVFLY